MQSRSNILVNIGVSLLLYAICFSIENIFIIFASFFNYLWNTVNTMSDNLYCFIVILIVNHRDFSLGCISKCLWIASLLSPWRNLTQKNNTNVCLFFLITQFPNQITINIQLVCENIWMDILYFRNYFIYY